jgi:hypothetical protein
MPEKTEPVDLTLTESGALCHLLMQSMIVGPDGKSNPSNVEKQPAWVLALYEKLSTANDKLRGR